MTQWMILKPFLRRLSPPLFLFSLVLWIFGLRSDILFSYPPHLRSVPAISNLTPSSPKTPSLCTHTICTPQSHSHDTHIHIIQYTPRMRRFSFAFTLFFILYQSTMSSLIPRAISICAPFFIARLFRCSDRFALILFVFCFPCSRIVSPSPLLLALATSSICALPLSVYLFFTPLFALRDSPWII